MGSLSGPRTGRHGAVNGLTSVRNWSLNWNQNLASRVLSSTRGGTMRFAGIEDWSASVEGFGGFPGIFPGDNVSLKMFAGPDDGVFGHYGAVYQGYALVDSLTINLQWQPTVQASWSANFSANGCMSQAPGEYSDDVLECVSQLCSIDLTYQDECVAGSGGTGDEGFFTSAANVESVTLTFNAANIPIVNSNTNCCTEREPGILDWSLAIVDQEQYPMWDYNKYYRFRVYIDAITYWSVAFGLLQDISNVRVDIESGALVTKTNNFVMASHACCDATPTLGEVVDPLGVVRWPEAIGTGT